MTRRSKTAILCGCTVLLGLVLSLAPGGSTLEETLGLDLLFRMRGARRPPPDVVVVTINRETADALDLTPEVEKWPRSFHTALVRNLDDAGAGAIAFDLFFQEARSEQGDRELADAVRDASNVVLCEALARDEAPMPAGSGKGSGVLVIERLLAPVPALARSALGLAPFPLPKIPVRVSQYWAFRGIESRPTFPVVAFQIFALDVYDAFFHLLEGAVPLSSSPLPQSRREVVRAGSVQKLMAALKELFKANPSAAGQMLDALNHPDPWTADLSERQIMKLRALIALYQEPGSRYFNFYGPPGTIMTLPYQRVLEGRGVPDASPPVDLKGKAVFIGVSGSRQVEKPDGFYTVFSQPNGVDLSGVEIAATAFANILENRHVEPLPIGLHLLVLVLWGVGLGSLCFLFSASASTLSVLGGAAAYGFLALHLFEASGLWLPLVTPLFVQAPFALGASLLWKYREVSRERRNIRKAFGLHLPDNVVDRLAKDLTNIRAHRQTLYGTCLCTDGARYTSLSEKLHPRDLSDFLNRYYETLFRPVRHYGGMVSDIVGDSMLAIWTVGRNEESARRRACLAALAIDRLVLRFNDSSELERLPTRMGLHFGQMSLGHIGGVDHFEYRPVGDAINTASRIENLNKHLGTRVLVSDDVISGLEGFLTRELGTFLPAGKSNPLILHELICRIEDADSDQEKLCAAFAEGLSAFKQRDWKKAAEGFRNVRAIYAEDGPARFYLRLCEHYRENAPQDDWDAVIRLEKK